MTKVKGFKGFKSDWTCRGLQYDIGKTYKHEGPIDICNSGFHFCRNPSDLWLFYGPCDARFARVTATDPVDDDNKSVTAEITIDEEIPLSELIDLVIDQITEDSGENVARGHRSNIAVSGYGSKIAVSGHNSNIAVSGHNSKIAVSGYGSKIEAMGDDSTIACADKATVRAGKGGAICIPYHDGTRTRFAVGYVGEDGIEAGVWYRAEDGKLVPVDGDLK